jgi:hypothetical protein
VRMKLPNWIKNFGSVEPDMTVTEESFLRHWREWAFRALAFLIITMTIVSLAESFHGLYEWFALHGVGGNWGYVAPVAIDFAMIIGELAIFTALTGKWHWKKRLVPWSAVFLGFSASVAGNIGHVYAQHPLPWDLTALVFPVSAAFGILIGFSVLKSLARERSDKARQSRLTMTAEVIGKESIYPMISNDGLRELEEEQYRVPVPRLEAPNPYGLDALIPPRAVEPVATTVLPAQGPNTTTTWSELDPKDARLRGADLNVKLRNTGQQPVLVD